jgi:hypothetical protein
MNDANYFIDQSKAILEARAVERDVDKERSMVRIVNTFNALTDLNLTVADGWSFMLILKLVRNNTKYQEDSIVDLISYAALLGEEQSSKENV